MMSPMEAIFQNRPLAAEGLVASEFLGFTLGSEEYAISILKVQEIRTYDPPTPIAYAPPFIKGVINLRGVIVPIVDLRIKLNLETVEYSPFTVVVILNVAGRVVGIVVDSVSEVISLTAAEISPEPDFSGRFDNKHIFGLAMVEGRVLIVVDIECLMTSAEMELIDDASE